MVKEPLFESSNIHSTPSFRQAMDSIHFEILVFNRWFSFKFQLLHSVFWAGPEEATPRIESEFTV